MAGPDIRSKQRAVVVLSVSALALVVALWQIGVFNPWRVFRQVKTSLNLRSHWQLDELESNTWKVTDLRIIAGKPLEKEKQRQILDVIRHLGPYDEKKKATFDLPASDPDRMQAIDQLVALIDVPFEGNDCRIYVNQFSAKDRARIRDIIGDPAQYGIADNTRPFSAR